VSAQLQTLFQQFESGSISPAESNLLVISGSNVGVQIQDISGGDFNALVAELQSDGLQVISTDPTTDSVAGMLPIAQLPTIGQLPQGLSVTAMSYKPAL
jgi:hypothetical protein